MTNERSDNLQRIRPKIVSALVLDNTSIEERFQNTTLRPILKLQHELLVEIFKNYITTHKNVFLKLSIEQRTDYIKNTISKDVSLKHSITNIIIALFTIEEYKCYTKNSSALNKRIIAMAKERLLSHMQLFEKKDS